MSRPVAAADPGTGIRCPVCMELLRVSITKSARDKAALMLVCPRDGRHFRGFVNDRAFVAQAIATLEARSAEITAIGRAS